jgi:hypothetical protein
LAGRRLPLRLRAAILWRRRFTAPAQVDPEPIDGHEVLRKLANLPISTWNYTFDPPSVRHLGPMAQDFSAAFHLGGNDRMIDMIDANGVVMVALQALYRRVVELEAEVARLKGDHGADPS